MHSNFILLLWRRKLSVLLVASSIVLVFLWTWAIFVFDPKTLDSGHILHDTSEGGSGNEHEDLLQKLISQANRILRSQHDHNATNIKAHTSIPTTESPLPSRHDTQLLSLLNPSNNQASLFPWDILAAKRKKSLAVGESFLFEDERLRILENQLRAKNLESDDINSIVNNMDYDRVLSSAERQSQYERDLQRMGVPVVADIGPDDPRPPHERMVHLDLKGAPPKLSFLKQLLPVLKVLGATGLLIEYEDMFPYTGALQSLSARNSYNATELKDFLEAAAMHGLTVMPLVQTFGHFEFALKLQDFQHLREIHESPQSICPSMKESMSLIEDMLTQVIEFHLYMAPGTPVEHGRAQDFQTNMTHIHIGCDEVARIGSCDRCRQRSRNEIFLNHVITISNFVRTKWPQLKVVIWDDMLRAMTLSEMQHSQVGRYVEPMIWVYARDIYQFIPPHLWDIYAKVFETAWAASAFKGAFGESLMIPPLQQHLENNIRWLAVIAKEGERFPKGFRGLALTGWQRYDHFAVLCELLPTAMPSLITSLSTVSKGYFSTDPKDNSILQVLQCAFYPDSRRSGHLWIELHPNSHHSQLFTSCNYPGSHVYRYSLRLFDKLTEAQVYLAQVHDKSAWMSDYNVRHNFSSPLRVHELTTNTPNIIADLVALSNEAHNLMYEVFDEHTIAEFIEQNIYPIIVALRKQIQNGEVLIHRKTWPRRPLPHAQELLDLKLIPGRFETAAEPSENKL